MAAAQTTPAAALKPTTEAVYVVDKGNSRIRRIDLCVTVANTQNADTVKAAAAAAAAAGKTTEVKTTPTPAPAPVSAPVPTITFPDAPIVTIVTGASESGFVDAVSVKDARFYTPNGIAFDSATQSLLVADTVNCRLRKIDLKAGSSIRHSAPALITKLTFCCFC
jgi:sugar lactone lactonase YvrE